MAYNRKVFDVPPSVVVAHDRTVAETVSLADGVSFSKSVGRSDFNKLLGDALGNLGASVRQSAAAFRALADEFGPPEEIIELAERRSAQLGIEVSCERSRPQRQLVRGQRSDPNRLPKPEPEERVWEVVVKTSRGSARCEPFLTDKQGLELPEDLALVTAWKNAFTQLGLL